MWLTIWVVDMFSWTWQLAFKSQ